MGGSLLVAPAALAAPIPMLPDEDEDAAEAANALAGEIEAMRLAGEFDRPAFMFDAVDLNGDGVGEIIEVSPPQQLEMPGWMRVFDGATEAVLYLLQPPIDEMGFGEHAAVVSDCDGDGLPELAVWSWLDVPQSSTPFTMEVRLRVFAGSSGELIGLLRTQREVGQPVAMADFVIEVAADANLDGSIDAVDVIEASAAVGTDAALTPTVDCKADGELTVADLGAVVQRAIEEPIARRVQLYSVGLRNVALVQPIAPPGDGIDPSSMGGGGGGAGVGTPCVVGWQGGLQCWSQAAYLGYDIYKLVQKMILCSGPQAAICVLAILCNMVSILNQILLFVDQCLTNGLCLPSWVTWVTAALAFLGHVCDGELSSLTSEQKEKLLELLRAARKWIA